MKLMTNKKVAIIGGGPGGLTLARLLQMQGVAVQVYERDVNRSARVQGATLNLNADSGLLAIHKAGLIEPFQAAFRPGADTLRLVDQYGNIRLDDSGAGEDVMPEIDRGPLRELLLNSLHDGTVVWDRQFSHLERDRDGVVISFKNGTTARADIVVAADGANSKLRSYVTSLQPLYAGVTIVEGAVDDVQTVMPQLHQMLNGGKICVLADEKTLFVILKGDGSVAFYTGHKTSESWARDQGPDFSNNDEVVAWFQREFTGWDPMWTELFRHASKFVPRPQYCAPLDQTWAALPDLTLLGDAAHVMPPYAGEGVNMAMLDAVELADCLVSDERSSVRLAIADYEKRMRARASASAEQTMKFTGIFHSADAMLFFKDFFAQHQ